MLGSFQASLHNPRIPQHLKMMGLGGFTGLQAKFSTGNFWLGCQHLDNFEPCRIAESVEDSGEGNVMAIGMVVMAHGFLIPPKVGG